MAGMAPAARAWALCICLSVALAGCTGFAKRGPFGSPEDAKISAEVRALYEQNGARGAPDVISVQTQGGVVYLRGLVSTPYEIEEAGSLAARVPGALRVRNLLSLDNSR